MTAEKQPISELNAALERAVAIAGDKLRLDEAARIVLQNTIADAFAPTLVGLGLVNGAREDSTS